MKSLEKVWFDGNGRVRYTVRHVHEETVELPDPPLRQTIICELSCDRRLGWLKLACQALALAVFGKWAGERIALDVVVDKTEKT
jgi:hypothetical protein